MKKVGTSSNGILGSRLLVQGAFSCGTARDNVRISGAMMLAKCSRVSKLRPGTTVDLDLSHRGERFSGSAKLGRAVGCATVLALLVLAGCKTSSSKKSASAHGEGAANGAATAASSGFSVADAQDNLKFARGQYQRMLDNVLNRQHLKFAKACNGGDELCWPRAAEDGEIYMEKLTKWTNGFFPGVLWMLLIADGDKGADKSPESMDWLNWAQIYTDGLASEATRGTTHDLGFLMYNSFGWALKYKGLTASRAEKYRALLATTRDTLVTRFSAEKGVIRSWDWTPTLMTEAIDSQGKRAKHKLSLAKPWQYPVIVDNMMNLELLLTSDNPAHHRVAYAHAASTKANHYFYADDDKDKSRPLAYHVFDYGERKPGNWQGMGNISAWSRGQGWSFYGMVTVAEFQAKAGTSAKDAGAKDDFSVFSTSLFDSLVHLMGDADVPDWDFFATRDDAPAIAANQSNATARFSRILSLCDYMIPADQLPYKGYAPIVLDADILSDDAMAFMKANKPARGDSFFVSDSQVAPCGTKPYDLKGRTIPKDTSAAAIYAAGAYRLAQATPAGPARDRYVAFADRIMRALTDTYRTDRTGGSAPNADVTALQNLGFVLHSATGNLPNASEIDTAMVYADYYFIEANLRKLQLKGTL